jgi:hypothetical protein
MPPPKKVLYTTLDIWIMMDCIFRQTSILLSAPTKPKRSPTAFCAAEGSPALLAIFRHVLLREIANIKVPRSHKNYHKNSQLFMAHVLPSSKNPWQFRTRCSPEITRFFIRPPRTPCSSGSSSCGFGGINIDRFPALFFGATHYLKIHIKKKTNRAWIDVWWSVLRRQD